jgi:GT2 family glycosyltransferase
MLKKEKFMKLYPKVYIVILNYNSYDDTAECIDSLKNIDYPNYSIVIVDNNSTDESQQKLRENFKDIYMIFSESNRGYANGNNLGIVYALNSGADYICVLNNDVVVEKDFLCEIIEEFEKDSLIGIAGACICDYYEKDKIQSFGANINLFTGLAQPSFKGDNYKKLNVESKEVDYLGGACFVIKKDVFSKIGKIPENYFLFFEETEFCLRAKKNGFKLVCLKKSRVYHKGSATISKFAGLSYYFLNRNRVVFMRRNANLLQMLIFLLYVNCEAVGRVIIRREPISIFKYYLEGLFADVNIIDFDKVKKFTKKN